MTGGELAKFVPLDQLAGAVICSQGFDSQQVFPDGTIQRCGDVSRIRLKPDRNALALGMVNQGKRDNRSTYAETQEGKARVDEPEFAPVRQKDETRGSQQDACD